MNLEEEIAQHQADQISKEIDRAVLWTALAKSGWTQVSISRVQDNKHAIDIREWLLDNCKYTYMYNGRNFLFQDSKEATMFILRWV